MHELLLLRVLLLCERELLTRCRCAQYDNQIVDLQGVQFPAGLQRLSLVSLRTAAAAVWSVFFFVLMFCGAGHACVVVASRVAVVWAGVSHEISMGAERQPYRRQWQRRQYICFCELFCYCLTNSSTRMTHTWIEAAFCVLFILVFLLATHEAFPFFSNVFSLTAAEVNRMLLRFLTCQTRSNQRFFHEHARAITREIAAPFAMRRRCVKPHTAHAA